MNYVQINSSWGLLLIALSDQGSLHGLWFEEQKHFPKLTSAQNIALIANSDEPKNLSTHALMTLQELKSQLSAYQNGTRQTFKLSLEPMGTEFQTLVWQCLTEIPYGQTITYKTLSQRVAKKMNRNSMSSQAIGQAVGRNPISILIPCHRVIGSNGTLTGYAGGLDKKQALLAHEEKHR
jgi:methylated-DNA-[protein]-cysteine S-methyltransferase